MKTAKAKILNARISLKSAVKVCKLLRGKKLSDAKKLLEDLIAKKISIDGKYYTNVAKKLLELLKAVEANAKKKEMTVENLRIKVVKADRGETFLLPKSRAKFRGRRAKSTHLTVEVA